uniref:Uncharacterized protein n=1 Tax=Nelumbo nucifera TaxID=4432 RepID=A0A822ZE53_NELNU|nr:TPA_asm: hypothetical protein HUJ06_002694 [Nelumbo nucifera]
MISISIFLLLREEGKRKNFNYQNYFSSNPKVIKKEHFNAYLFSKYFRCDLRIVSDANSFFIDTILKHHGLMDCFTEINTNPSYVDDEGKLRIFPFHDFTSSPHSPCPPNMCKVNII